AVLVGATATGLGLISGWTPIASAIPAGGLIGSVLAAYLLGQTNMTGAIVVTAAAWVLALYLVATFGLARMLPWLFALMKIPVRWMMSLGARFRAWRAARVAQAKARAEQRAAQRAARLQEEAEVEVEPPIVDPMQPVARAATASAAPAPTPTEDIPIRM